MHDSLYRSARTKNIDAARLSLHNRHRPLHLSRRPVPRFRNQSTTGSNPPPGMLRRCYGVTAAVWLALSVPQVPADVRRQKRRAVNAAGDPGAEQADHSARLPNGRTRKTVRKGRENPVPTFVFFFIGNGSGNGKGGRKNEIDITKYQEQNITVGNTPITIGNR